MKKKGITGLMGRLGKQYQGGYVGVVDGRVVASGNDELEVFKKTEQGLPKDKEIGILYVPSPKDVPLLLKVK